ncbi:MAG: exodeoxyribonuclease III [Spirosomataceae bacterium]
MRIVSYNVNGIRSNIKKGLFDWLAVQNPDIVCVQEIKLSETELVEPSIQELGYQCFWFPAVKKGYSGVAIFSKISPESVAIGMENPIYDQEGRIIRINFPGFSILSCYFPSGSSSSDRQDFKMKFLTDFYVFVENLQQNVDNLIIVGDVNICHEAIDIHNPKANANSSGFLPEERKWVTDFLRLGFVDSFRFFNQEPHNYTWWTYRAGAKSKNLGWRIDYIFVSSSLSSRLRAASIYPEVLMSDHCPISIDIDL